jgi:nucleoside-diphosphate-sugar epimerase
MKILLIGHEGYLGTGLLAYLRRSHSVLGWDKKEDLFALDAALLAREGIEAVINLSVIDARGSAAFLADELPDKINVQGARHIARILKGSDIAWIQMSTREVFPLFYKPKDVKKTAAGFRPKFLIDESYPYLPANFYGKSKLMAEWISEGHPKSAVIRLTTCYTDYSHPAGNWVVSLIRKAVEGKPIPLTNGGLQFRDPLHIDDLGRLMELVFEKGVFGQKIHAGGGKENLISLKEFVRLADPKAKIEKAPGGDYGFAFDNSKAFELLGWKPSIKVREKIPVIAENIRRGRSGR